jgi:hypothetical protein
VCINNAWVNVVGNYNIVHYAKYCQQMADTTCEVTAVLQSPAQVSKRQTAKLNTLSK